MCAFAFSFFGRRHAAKWRCAEQGVKAMVPKRLVLVCAGNTCRSPLAAVIAHRLFAERELAIAVTSAGLSATPGVPAAETGRAVARRLGLNLEEHRARRVEDVRDENEALWLAMTVAQRDELRARLAEGAWVEAVLPFARTCGADLAGGDSVPDPVGLDERAYEDVASMLQAALRAIADAWRTEARGTATRREAAGMQTKTVALPRLGGLKPTLESTALKLLEEAGELAEMIGKYRALSGERQAQPPQQVMGAIGQELLDVAQTAITMMFVLEEQHGVDIQSLLHEHVRKLAAKGYLEPAEEAGSAP